MSKQLSVWLVVAIPLAFILAPRWYNNVRYSDHDYAKFRALYTDSREHLIYFGHCIRPKNDAETDLRVASEDRFRMLRERIEDSAFFEDSKSIDLVLQIRGDVPTTGTDTCHRLSSFESISADDVNNSIKRVEKFLLE